MGYSDNACVDPTLIYSAGVHLEGVITTPNDVAKWGKMAGAILAGDEDNRRLWAFYPDKTAMNWVVSAAIEDLDLIPTGENFFGVNYGLGLLLGASWDQFVGHEGKILATQEFQSLWLLTWDKVNNIPAMEQITTAADSPVQPSQWEHVTFAPAGIREILPADFSLCIKAEYGNTVETGITPLLVPGSATAQANYAYNIAGTTAKYSSGSTAPAPQVNTLLMYLTQDAQNTFSLVLVMDGISDAVAGGTLSLTIASKNLGNPTIVVQDDPTTTLVSSTGDFADS